MGMLLQVRDDKVDYLAENIENGLRYLGKAMQCVDEMKQMGGISQQRMDGMGQQRNGGGYDGMSGERRWGNQYGGGYTNRRDYINQGSQMDGMTGNRMPPYVDPMYM